MVESAIKPLYFTEHPNDPVPLVDECDVELRTSSVGLIFGKGNIVYRWAPIESIRFDLSHIAGTPPSQLAAFFDQSAILGQSAILNVPLNPPINLEVRVKKHHFSMHSGEMPTVNIGGLAFRTRLDEELLCDELKFHLVNLHDYYGARIKYPSGRSSNRRIVLSNDKWEITIDAVENLKELLDELEQDGGFAITHVGLLRKRDNSTFKVKEALEQLKLLGFFLSFVEGRWCFPRFMIGLLNGKIVFRDLCATGRISQWDEIWRWSPSEAYDLDLAYKGFVPKWNDPKWRETIALIIEFYVRANIYHVVNLSVLDSFMALDRLASGYCLENVNPASERIRQALGKARLATRLPSSDLCRFYGDFYRINCPGKIADGPNILTDFRHGVVHGNRPIVAGDKRNRPNLDEDPDSSNPIVPFNLMRDAQNFGLWCVEMSLLFLIGYNGHYNDRLTRAQEVPVSGSTNPLAAKSP